MATVFLNGEFVSRDAALVSAFDAGLQHGVGLFETLLATRSENNESGGGGDHAGPWRIVHAREHLDRLVVSARQLGLSESLRISALEEAVGRTVAKAAEDLKATGTTRLRVRVTITGGDLNLLEQGRTGSTSPDRGPTVLIVASPATAYPREMFERGVGVVVADFKSNPLDPYAGHKTLNYWPRLRELQIAAAKRAGEALIFQVTNHLAGGCVSNAFLIKDDVLITPIARGEEEEVARLADGDAGPDAEPSMGMGRSTGATMPSPVLPGIVRRWTLEQAQNLGLDIERRMVSISDVFAADELFLTNSSWGVLPVVKVEREAIGDGVVGPVSAKLHAAWAEMCNTKP
jgi:branched-chain amino acid aminotransferase